MPALFPRWTNTAVVLVVVTVVASVVGTLVGLMLYVRTPHNTGQFLQVDQPVEFDHRHHVLDDEIDCLYCHTGAETGPFAGVPATEVCMGCHNQVWNESALLETVRRSYFSGKPIPWNRVHDLGDFVYFHHGVHVQAGVGCVHCHGRVDLMPRMAQAQPLTMGWCLDCHRDPVAKVGATPTVTADYRSMWGTSLEGWQRDWPSHPRSITRLTTCSACHR